MAAAAGTVSASRRPSGRVRTAISVVTFVSFLLQPGCSTSTKSTTSSRRIVTCGSRHVDIASAKRISTTWTMEQIVRLLGPPERNSGSGRVVNEWTCTDGSVIDVSSGGDYGDPVASVEFRK